MITSGNSVNDYTPLKPFPSNKTSIPQSTMAEPANLFPLKNKHTRRKTPFFWRNQKGDLGIIFGKNDLPDIMLKRKRIKNVIYKKIEKDEINIKKKYMINHPVLKLLERNAKNSHANDSLMNTEKIEVLKNFAPINSDSLLEFQSMTQDDIKFIDKRLFDAEKNM